MQTRVITAHIPLPLAKKVDALAKQLERPRGWIIKQALRQLIDTEEFKRESIERGLADVKAGRVSSHDEMEQWIKSLRRKKSAV